MESYRSCPYRHMSVWDADGTGCIEFDCADVTRALDIVILQSHPLADSGMGTEAVLAGVFLRHGEFFSPLSREPTSAA